MERDREALARLQQIDGLRRQAFRAHEDAADWHDRLSDEQRRREELERMYAHVSAELAEAKAQLAAVTVTPAPAEHVRAQDHD